MRWTTRPLNLAHAFGPIEVRAGALGARNYDAAHVGAAIATSDSGAAAISLGYTGNSLERDISQSASYAHRLYRDPELFALYAGAGIDAVEITMTPTTGPSTSGHYLAPYGAIAADVQVTPNLAVAENVSLEVPVSTSGTNAGTYAGETTTLMACLHHWDFYAQFAIHDLSATRRLFAAIGFTHRWF